MSRDTIRYSVLSCYAGPCPATGFHFHTGFNDLYTGANSGENLIKSLQRVQTVTDGFSLERTNVNQLGQLSYVSQELINQPSVPVSINWISADLSNEKKLGLYVSGNGVGALKNILEKTEDNRNIFLAIAPEGFDSINYTGQMGVVQLNNCYFESYSAEASVGGFATASASFQGLNFSTSTGSINQDLNAINLSDGQIVPGKKFTLPVATTGTEGSVAALRYGDITASISGVQGLLASDLKIQSYNISFSTNLQDLLKLGSRFAYAKVPQFPIDLNASVTANFGDLTTGSLSNLFCADEPFNLIFSLYEPGCGGYGPLAARYTLKGMKLQGQDFGEQNVGSNTATVTLNYLGQIGGSTDQNVNLFLTGKS